MGLVYLCVFAKAVIQDVGASVACIYGIGIVHYVAYASVDNSILHVVTQQIYLLMYQVYVSIY